MSEFVRWFLALQMLAGAGWFATLVLARTPVAASTALRVSRLLMVSALCLPVLVSWVAVRTPWNPELQLWVFAEQLGVAPVMSTLAPGARLGWVDLLPSLPSQPWPVLLYGSVLLACVWSVRSWSSLRGIVRRSAAHGTEQDVEVRVSRETDVPFAVWFPRQRIVVVDPETLEHAEDYRIALLHERQHHVQGDPLFAYVTILLRSLCVVNPFAHAWAARASELEEFACDEGVLASGQVSLRAYGQCLVRAAQRVAGQEQSPYAVGIMGRGQGSLLKRRLTRLAARTVLPSHLWPALALSMGWMTVTAWAADGLLVGPPLGSDELRSLAADAPARALPYPEGEDLLYAVSAVAGDPERLRFVRRAVYRGREELAAVRAELLARGLPPELAALPLVESGYTNRRPQDARDGAGLWRLDPPTARAYGLRVHDTADERLDPEASTRAALDLLVDLHAEFDDWVWVIAAFHYGVPRVRERRLAVGEGDTWATLGRASLAEYPALVLTSALLIDRPELLDPR